MDLSNADETIEENQAPFIERGLELLADCREHLRGNSQSEALRLGLESVALLSRTDRKRELSEALEEIAAIHYNAGRYAEALEQWACSLPLRTSLGETAAMAKLHRNAGITYSRIGSFDNALRELTTSLELFTRISDRKGMGAALNSIGIIDRRLGDFEAATRHSLEAVALLDEEPRDRARLAEAYLNLGGVSERFGRHDEALEYLRRSLEVAEEHQHAEIYNDMATVHTAQGDFAGALERYLQAYREQKRFHRPFARAIMIGNIGNAYLRLGRYPIAIRYQRLSSAFFEKCGDLPNLARTLRNLASSQIALGMHEEGVATLQRAMATAVESNAEWEIGRVHEELYGYHLGIRNFEHALEHYTESRAIHDRLVGAEKEKALATLQSRFELERHLKEEEIRQRNNVVQSVIDALEAERERIARDLHDGVGQLLAAVGINLSMLRSTFEQNGNGTGVPVPLERAIGIVGDITGDLRTMSHALGSSTLRECGLYPALAELLSSFESSHATRFELMSTGMEERLPQAIETALFRIAQELIANVLRHAGATEATVQIVWDDREIRLEVGDNGVGFDVGISATGMGRRNVAVRAAAIGAELIYDSAPGHGTTVIVVVPMP